jgi:hypothetical protein
MCPVVDNSADLPGYIVPEGPPAKAALTLTELDAALRHFILQTYHHTPHSVTGEAPQARWSRGTSRASNSPGASASPHTGFSSGMTPSAETASGTADGTTDTDATSPGSGKSAAQR